MTFTRANLQRTCTALGISAVLWLGGVAGGEPEAPRGDDEQAASAPPMRQEVPGPGSSFGRDTAPADAFAPVRHSPRDDTFEGYDFGQVVQRVESSVDPLQREMDSGFRAFTRDVEAATELLEQGRTREAITLSRSAIMDLLDIRDDVVEPMWQGQRYLNDQIAEIRQRVARAAAAAGDELPAQLDGRTEGRLDALAADIHREADPQRRQRLIAHYRTVRELGRIRQLAQRMSPDQRELWTTVLQVLNQAATAHQQVLMGSEVLFTQLEVTAANLEDHLTLMDTVEGASELLGAVQGLDEQRGGLAEFAENMHRLQQGVAGFSESLENVLSTNMHELEAQIDAVQARTDADGTVSRRMDDELTQRIERLRGERE